MASSPLRWLYLDLNSFFASVEQQLDPGLRGRPVAVGPERVDSGTIIAASYEAKAHGVRTGMRVGEARRLCPALRFVGGDHGRYAEAHRRIVAEVWRHVPVTHVCSIDEVACRLLDNENGRDEAIALARRIKAGIRENVGECLTSSVGIAPSRLLAKIAADMEKPDGLTILESHQLPDALRPLALRDIPGIGARMEARLAARGIRTTAELLAQDPRSATSAWGSIVGARLWHALHGTDLPEPPRKSRSIGHSHVLSPQVRTRETARLTARRLLVKAASRLREAGCVARHLTVYARLESRRRFSLTTRLAPTDDNFPLLAALATLWQPLLDGAGAERIQTIGVSLDDIQPAAGTQLSLFDTSSAASRELARAIDRIQARFGRNAISLGPAATGRANLIGAKIAFGRIPDTRDFETRRTAARPGT